MRQCGAAPSGIALGAMPSHRPVDAVGLEVATCRLCSQSSAIPYRPALGSSAPCRRHWLRADSKEMSRSVCLIRHTTSRGLHSVQGRAQACTPSGIGQHHQIWILLGLEFSGGGGRRGTPSSALNWGAELLGPEIAMDWGKWVGRGPGTGRPFPASVSKCHVV